MAGTRINELPSGSLNDTSYLPMDDGTTTQKLKVSTLTPKKVSISLPTASWSGTPYSQTVVISGVSNSSKIDLQCDSTVINQLLSDGTTALYTTNNNGTISVIAVGEKPSINLTLQATISEVIV